MNAEELTKRTQQFTVNIIELTQLLPKSAVSDVVIKQIVRSASSVGANYRAALRGKSDKDFKYKIKIVEEEADETLFWLEVLRKKIGKNTAEIDSCIKEADELTAIFTATSKTLYTKKRIATTKIVNGRVKTG